MVYYGYATLRNYTDEQLLEKIKKVRSIAGLLRELELAPAGGNYDTIKKLLKRLNADTSHWTGQGWSLGHQNKDYIEYANSSSVKVHLLSVRGYSCEKCKLDKWMGEDVTIELEHIDGDKFNNSNENLLLLCPNCHSQTKTWRRRKTYLRA